MIAVSIQRIWEVIAAWTLGRRGHLPTDRGKLLADGRELGVHLGA